jgi:hypothetical protein
MSQNDILRQLAQGLQRAVDSGNDQVAQEIAGKIREIQGASVTDPKISQAEAAALGGAQGVTFGGADELAGLVGGDSADMRYRLQLAREQHPVTAYGSEVAGGVATGYGAGKLALTGIKNAPAAIQGVGNLIRGSTAARTASYAGLGALEGATYGSLAAEPGERGSGALWGGIFGGVAAPAMAGASAIGGWTWGKVRQALSDAQPVARQKAAQILQEVARQEGVSVDDVVGFLRQNPDLTLADFSDKFRGEMAHALPAATREGREGAVSYYRGRNREAAGRLEAQVDETMGTRGRTFQQRLDEISAEKGRIGREQYETVLNSVDDPPRTAEGGWQLPDERAALLQRPSVARAWREAEELAAENGEEVTSFWQRLHWARSAMGRQIDQAKRNTPSDLKHLIENKKALDDWLDTDVPGYGQARQQYADQYSIQRAAENGRNLFAGNKPFELLDDMADLVPGSAEQEAFVIGVKDAIRQEIRKRGANTVRGVLNESQRSRLRAVLGDEVDEIFNAIDNEVARGESGVLAERVRGEMQNPMPLLGGGETTALAIGNKAIAAASLVGRIRGMANQVTPATADELLKLLARPMRTPQEIAEVERALTQILRQHYGSAGIGGALGGEFGGGLGGMLEER